jgi:membrane protein YqaA with SNARE-associated domain
MNNLLGSGWKWFEERARGRAARVWLFLLSFSESSFFLIPPDILLVPMLIVSPSRWLYLAALTTTASVLGALFGYVIGAVFYDTIGASIIEFYSLEERFLEVEAKFDNNTFLAMFLAAFTPIPFKVFVLSGGFFKVNLVAFTLASIAGRGLRFFLVAYITRVFGAHVAYIFIRYTNIATAILFLLLVFIFLSYFGIPLIP